MLEVKDVYSGYGRMEVLHGITLRIDKGEIVSVLGPNGAGKSTLLNTIFGIATLHRGRIEFEGRNISKMKPNQITRIGIGYTPQIGNIFPTLTVMENLQLGAYFRKDDISEDIKEMFDLFPEIARRRNNLARTLSGGERQMLAVARALMARPRLVLLDEPTAGLAPKAALTLMKKIAEIRERGITILLVEQNVKRALEVSDRAYILVGGRITHEDTAENLMKEERFERFFFAK